MRKGIIWSGRGRQVSGKAKTICLQHFVQRFDVWVVYQAQPSAQRADFFKFIKRIFHESVVRIVEILQGNGKLLNLRGKLVDGGTTISQGFVRFDVHVIVDLGFSAGFLEGGVKLGNWQKVSGNIYSCVVSGCFVHISLDIHIHDLCSSLYTDIFDVEQLRRKEMFWTKTVAGGQVIIIRGVGSRGWWQPDLANGNWTGNPACSSPAGRQFQTGQILLTRHWSFSTKKRWSCRATDWTRPELVRILWRTAGWQLKNLKDDLKHENNYIRKKTLIN